MDMTLKFAEPPKNVGICPNFGSHCHGDANNRKSSKNTSCYKPLRKFWFALITV